MKIVVQLFAAAKEVAGQSHIELSLEPNSTVGDLRQALVEQVDALKSLHTALLVAVNNDYVMDEHQLVEGDEVACFPPVSGG